MCAEHEGLTQYFHESVLASQVRQPVLSTCTRMQNYLLALLGSGIFSKQLTY